MPELLRLGTAHALRAYGTWHENEYVYGNNGTDPIAVKRLTWQENVKTVHGDLDLSLSYYADAVVDPRRMNDLAYLAEQERSALKILESMVQAAVQGIGYIGVPNPVHEFTKDVVQIVGEWTTHRGYPEDWAQQIERVIGATTDRLNKLRTRYGTMRAQVDLEKKSWGLRVMIHPPESRGDT